MYNIPTLSTNEVKKTDVILRVDFNVSLNKNHTIGNDTRIKQALPTIRYLLQKKNRVLIISHLGRPEGKETSLSLKSVATLLEKLIPDYEILFASDISEAKMLRESQSETQIILLENIRFFSEEEENDKAFAKKLASLGKVYINDAFSVSHRKASSIVAITQFLPSFAGFLLEKEVKIVGGALSHPRHPFIAVLGGAKISTKIIVINRLFHVADTILIGGGLANNFLFAKGLEIGNSFYEKDSLGITTHLLSKHEKQLILPTDVLVASSKDSMKAPIQRKVTEIQQNEIILDIGPQTQAHFASFLSSAATIIWNGPVGYIENPIYKGGTDFLYYMITENESATSIIGGGETLAALEKKEYLDKITHISTGGGAMLEFIENGTLPGIVALEK